MTAEPTQPIAWLPFCGRTRCYCMEPSVNGPCDEHKDNGPNPRCAECGWPEYRHTTPEPVTKYIARVLRRAGWYQVDLAERTGLSTKHINQIMLRRIAISTEIAMLFETAAGFDAAQLLTMQARWQVHQLRTAATEGDHVTDDRSWSTGDAEPGPDVDLLVDTKTGQFLARISHGWVWASTLAAAQPQDTPRRDPLTWTFATLAEHGHPCLLRVPTHSERAAWTQE